MRVFGYLLALSCAYSVTPDHVTAQVTPDALVSRAITVIEQNRVPSTPSPQWARDAASARASHPTSLADARVVIRALLRTTPAPGARYLTPDEFKRFFDEVTGQPHIGVGLIELLSIDDDPEHGGLYVVTPVPGSPAARALRPGDRIEQIAGRNSRLLSLSQNTMLLRGDSGTEVQVSVRRGTQLLQIPLQRERITPPTGFAQLTGIGADTVLYLRIGQFTQGSGTAFLAALQSAGQSRVSGIVLDLRNNPGGLLPEAQQVIGALLGPVPIGSIEGKSGPTQITATGAQRTTLPVAVLINRGTASAAELVASALGDSKAAVTIGAPTVGKGIVNTPFPLPDASCLLVATGALVTVGGKQIAHVGVTPAIAVAGDSPWEVPEIKPGSSQDKQFARAVAELAHRK